jgi:hypothetical protein
MAFGRTSIFGKSNNVVGESIQMSPTSYSKLKDDDQEALIDKSHPVDISEEEHQEPMDTVNLN